MTKQESPTFVPTALQTKLAARILDDIRERNLPPGTRLTEVGLANQLGVSRSPVRGALTFLAAQGLIGNRETLGYCVIDVPMPEESSALPTSDDDQLYTRLIDDRLAGELDDDLIEADLLRRYGVSRGVLLRVLMRLSEEGVLQRKPGHGWLFLPTLSDEQAKQESYRFRLLLEPAALMEPTFHLDMQRLDACRKNQQALQEGKPDALAFFEGNAAFHEFLAASSGNRFILQAIQQQNRLRRLSEYRTVADMVRVKGSCAEHLTILDALERGENEWAAALLHRHLDLASRL
ncbi:GntR family transcriptional regulator [Chitinivorax sp. B]|uniref:GntR family transcriptional regulator n=1 Tax=Chitinivorax sp. B TaxID=2502235 RepID=UPI0010F82699|nr:GntR family transcriptional regulator [Chitinivorax sp. B]